MKVTIKRVYPVYAWSWDTEVTPDDVTRNNRKFSTNANLNADSYTFFKNYRNEEDDVCGICRVSYNSVCPSCKLPGRSCPLVVGECHHNFHSHCIYRWLDTQTSRGLCPMCRQEFKLSENLSINIPQLKLFEALLLKNRERALLLDDDDDDDNDNEEEEPDVDAGIVMDAEVGPGSESNMPT